MNETYDQPTFVDGACAAATTPNAHGFVTFEIQVDGFQYPVKLSTKSGPVIEQARTVGGNPARWHYTPSQGGQNPHNPGTFYTNRRLSKVEPLLTADGPPPSSAPADQPGTPAPSLPASPATQVPVPEAVPSLPASGDRDNTPARIARYGAVEVLAATFNQIAVMSHGPDRSALEASAMGLAARLAVFVEHGPATGDDLDNIPF